MSLRSAFQACSETFEPCFVRRQTEAQEIDVPCKAPGPDMLPRQRIVQTDGSGMSRQPIERGAAGDGESSSCENGVERCGLGLQIAARFICPMHIAKRRAADRHRRPRHGPWPERIGYAIGDRWGSDGKAKPQTGQTVKLSERTQDDNRQTGAKIGHSDIRIDISEGFVDHKPSVAMGQFGTDICDGRSIGDPTVRIIGVDQHGMARVLGKPDEIFCRHDFVAGACPGQRMLCIRRRTDGDGTGYGKARQPLDQRLSACGRDDGCIGRYPIGCTRRRDQRIHICRRRQAMPDRLRQTGRDRPGPGIDTRRKVEPVPRRTTVTSHRAGKIAAMFHALLMPPRSSKRESLTKRICAAFVTVTALAYSFVAHATDRPRIASINVCTDQLLLALADSIQIVGVSPHSRDRQRSWAADEADHYRRLSGEAEDLLILKPDLVVSGRFTRRATRELLKEKGVRVVEFDVARSLEDVRRQILRMGELVGHRDRAQHEIARLDAGVERARNAASRTHYRVLSLSRRGWVSGNDSLMTSLLAAAGLSNAARDIGIKSGGFVSLESIVRTKPDLILIADNSPFAEDQGRAFLLHPALEKLYPPAKRLVVPERLTVCGGTMLSEALDRLTAEIERVSR